MKTPVLKVKQLQNLCVTHMFILIGSVWALTVPQQVWGVSNDQTQGLRVCCYSCEERFVDTQWRTKNCKMFTVTISLKLSLLLLTGFFVRNFRQCLCFVKSTATDDGCMMGDNTAVKPIHVDIMISVFVIFKKSFPIMPYEFMPHIWLYTVYKTWLICLLVYTLNPDFVTN